MTFSISLFETRKFSQPSLPLLALLVLALVGCAKTRQDQFAQGQGNNLLEISQYNGKTFAVKTGAKQQAANSATSANDIKIEGNEKINNLDLVDLQKSHPLLNNVPFRGKDNHDYKISLELTEKFLIVNKHGSRSEIPSQEITYAASAAGGYKVPLVGYPVTLYRVEKARTSMGEETHELREFPVQTLSEATHFRYDENNRTLFKAVAKNDVFPRDLFQGEWFYSSTIVSASTESAVSVGFDLTGDFDLQSVSRVKFVEQQNRIRAVNLNVAKEINTKDAINLRSALELPVEWLDFRVKQEGPQANIAEEQLDDDHHAASHWKNRKYVKVDFAKAISATHRQNEYAIVQHLDLTDNFISFLIYYPEQEIRVRYALRRAHEPKKSRLYHKEDRQKFGFFATVPDYIKDSFKIHRPDDKRLFINRFVPDNNKIVYHFTDTTPERFKEAGRRAIENWNKAFKKAGSNIEVVLDESISPGLGDIRYNLINIVDTKAGTRLLGYGPSIADSKSGEIISATTNAYVYPFRSGLINTIRNYIRFRTGLIQASSVGTPQFNVGSSMLQKQLQWERKTSSQIRVPKTLSHLLQSNETTITKMLKAEKIKELTELQSVHANDNVSRFTNYETMSLASIQSEIKKFKHGTSKKFNPFQAGSSCSFQVTNKDMIDDIEKNCKAILDPYIASLGEGQRMVNATSEREIEILEACAEKLIDDVLVATLIHEIGHNLGLRHNFIASADPENFARDEEGNVIAQTSSTMDYAAANVHELLHPGPYDVAAIKFGYTEKVDLQSNQTATLNTEKSIKDQNLTVRPFKYCTDEDTDAYQTNPLCNRHDTGESPIELVKNSIQLFHSIYEVNGKRYDRASFFNGPAYAAYTANVVFLRLRRVYEHWRVMLAKYTGQDNRYLDQYSAEDMRAILERMKNEGGEWSAIYKEYYPAVDMSYKFLKSVIFTPIKMCIVASKAQPNMVQPVSLDKIRDMITDSSLNSTAIQNCKDQIVAQEFLAPNNLELIDERGVEFGDVRDSADVDSPDYHLINTVGLQTTREVAMVFLFGRTPFLLHLRSSNFMPSFLDNPIYREDMKNEIVNRLSKGQDLQKLDANAQGFLSLFNTEKELLVNLYKLYVANLPIPGNNLNLNISRIGPFQAASSSDPALKQQILQSDGAMLLSEITENMFIFASKQNNPVAYDLIALRNKINSAKQIAEIFQTVKIDEKELVELTKTLPELTPDNLAKMNLKDFNDMVLAYNKKAQAIEPQKLKILVAIMPNEFSFVNGLSTAIGNAAKDKSLEEQKEISKTPVLDFIKENAQVPPNFLESLTFKNRQLLLQKMFKEAKAFKANNRELEAQQNVITEALLAL